MARGQRPSSAGATICRLGPLLSAGWAAATMAPTAGWSPSDPPATSSSGAVPVPATAADHAQAVLVLADGTVFPRASIGAEGETTGEVVFNTALTGYQEILTDPSYCRQIVTLTYPHIGNYGSSPRTSNLARCSRQGSSSRMFRCWPQISEAPHRSATIWRREYRPHRRHRHATPDPPAAHAWRAERCIVALASGRR